MNDAVTYRARTIVRFLEIMDELVAFGDDDLPFRQLHDVIQEQLPKFYPLTGDEYLPDDAPDEV